MTLDGLRPLVIQLNSFLYLRIRVVNAFGTSPEIVRSKRIFSGSHQAVTAIPDESIARDWRLIPIQIGYPLVFQMDHASTQGHPALLESLLRTQGCAMRFMTSSKIGCARNRSSSYKRSMMAFLISWRLQWRHPQHRYHDYRTRATCHPEALNRAI